MTTSGWYTAHSPVGSDLMVRFEIQKGTQIVRELRFYPGSPTHPVNMEVANLDELKKLHRRLGEAIQSAEQLTKTPPKNLATCCLCGKTGELTAGLPPLGWSNIGFGIKDSVRKVNYEECYMCPTCLHTGYRSLARLWGDERVAP